MLSKFVPSWAYFGIACLWCMAGLLLPIDTYAQAAAPEGPLVERIEGDIEPDGLVRVKVRGLQEWAERERQSAWRLVPHVDGRPLAGLYPSGVSLREGWLQFHLRVTPTNENNWVDLLSPPVFERFVTFSVGLEQSDALPSRYQEGTDRLARVIVIRRGWAVTAAALVLACALGFVYLARHTRLLFQPIVAGAGAPKLRLSLARVQFALWFFAIFTAFLTIWLTTGRTDSLNSSIVAILGISSGTAVGESLLWDKNPLVASAESDQSDFIPNHHPGIWELLQGLACDAHGASIYRFQVLAWTALLLVTFVSQVYFDLSMPVFGSELLYLLGLSSGTYIAQGAPATRRSASAAMTASESTAVATPSPPPRAAASQGEDSGSHLTDLALRLRAAEAAQPSQPR